MKNNINFNKFNKTRYIELLKKEEILRNEATSLFNENCKEDLELLSYDVILENQIYYNRKAEYIFLIEEYLRENARKDGANIFREDAKALKNLEKEGLQRLANFFIDPKSTEFSALINQIVGHCEFLTFGPEYSYGITLDQFRDSIEKIFFKMQKYLDQ